MWIFAKHGFLSIVEPYKECGPEVLLVRARVKGDIEHYFPEAIIQKTDERDYLYRTLVPRYRVQEVIGKAAASVDYPNFKGSLTDKIRGYWYGRVWSNMCNMQDEMDEE